MAGCFVVVWSLRGRRGASLGDRSGKDSGDTARLLRAMIDELDRKTERLERLLTRAESLEERLGGEDRREASGETADAFVNQDPANAAVCRMADEGRTVAEISSALGQPSGQVELVLNLRRAARAASPASE